jgi:hypothetical protein
MRSSNNKKNTTLGVSVTDDELKEINRRIREEEDKTGKRMSVSAYIRKYMLEPHLNGNALSLPDSKPDTEQTIEPATEGKYAHLLDDI